MSAGGTFIQLFHTLIGTKGGIWTHGPVTVGNFQDSYIKPDSDTLAYEHLQKDSNFRYNLRRTTD